MTDNSGRFAFDGDVAGYLGTRVLAALVCVVTLGFGFPLALVLAQRWNARHLTVGGRRLVFTGRAGDLFRDWRTWWPLTVVTLGVYAFSVVPKVRGWIWDHTDYQAVWQLEPAPASAHADRPLAPPSGLHLAFFTEVGRHRVG
ncbi:MAG: hypothetical protein WB797_05010 [Nocardioides sp.]